MFEQTSPQVKDVVIMSWSSAGVGLTSKAGLSVQARTSAATFTEEQRNQIKDLEITIKESMALAKSDVQLMQSNALLVQACETVGLKELQDSNGNPTDPLVLLLTLDEVDSLTKVLKQLRQDLNEAQQAAVKEATRKFVTEKY